MRANIKLGRWEGREDLGGDGRWGKCCIKIIITKRQKMLFEKQVKPGLEALTHTFPGFQSQQHRDDKGRKDRLVRMSSV